MQHLPNFIFCSFEVQEVFLIKAIATPCRGYEYFKILLSAF